LEVIERHKRVLGQENPDTLTSMAKLASTFWNQGRWKEAEELQATGLEICSKVLGQEHPSTLTSMASLASTYWNQGRWKEALKLMGECVQLRARILGTNQPYSLSSLKVLSRWQTDRLENSAADERSGHIMI
jgi:hypothetical protein